MSFDFYLRPAPEPLRLLELELELEELRLLELLLELLVLDELLVPAELLLLEPLLTLPLELRVEPLLLEFEPLLGRLTPLLPVLPVRPLEELLPVPLLLPGRLTLPLLEGFLPLLPELPEGVLPLPVFPLLGFTLLELPPLGAGVGGLLLWLLPELMLPPSVFGLTVALGAGSLPSL